MKLNYHHLAEEDEEEEAAAACFALADLAQLADLLSNNSAPPEGELEVPASASEVQCQFMLAPVTIRVLILIGLGRRTFGPADHLFQVRFVCAMAIYIVLPP